jgi:hypothetical protein
MVWRLIKDLKFDYTIQNTRKTEITWISIIYYYKTNTKKHQMLEIAPMA